MDAAGHAGIEGMQRAQDFQRLLRLGDRGANQRGFVGARVAARVARSGVPGARHHALVIHDRAVADMHPMAERAARRLVKAGAEAIARPAAGVPLRIVLDAVIAPRHVVGQVLHPAAHRLDQHLRLDRARGDAAERREQRLGADARASTEPCRPEPWRAAGLPLV